MSSNPTNLPITFFDGDSFAWEIDEDGYLRYRRVLIDPITGEKSFDDNYGYISNSYEYYYSDPADIYTENNGREIVIGARTLGVYDERLHELSITVTRKIFVSEDASFVRILDIFTNTSSDDSDSYEFSSYNQLPSLESQNITTSSGDNNFDKNDNWIAVNGIYDDELTDNNLSIIQVVAGDDAYRPLSTYANGGFRYYLDLEPGETKAVMSFVTRSQDVAEQLAEMQPIALTGMSPEEKSQIINFDTGVNDNNLPPDLVITGSVAEDANFVLGEEVSVTYTLKNQGKGATPADTYQSVNVYISDDDKFDDGEDTYVDYWSESLESPLASNENSPAITKNITKK